MFVMTRIFESVATFDLDHAQVVNGANIYSFRLDVFHVIVIRSIFSLWQIRAGRIPTAEIGY